MQIIFCVESNKKSQIDKLYIDNFIKHHYKLGTTKIDYVYLEGKFNFNNTKVIKEIDKKVKTYFSSTHLETNVIYCCDKDAGHIKPEDQRFIKDLKSFCINKKYELVWFVRNIEEVMVGTSVRSQEKRKRVIEFLQKQEVKKLNTKDLSYKENVARYGCSNLMTVLDRYLTRY